MIFKNNINLPYLQYKLYDKLYEETFFFLKAIIEYIIIETMADIKIIAENRKARFDYFIEDTYECGIELQGTEVKSVKNGNISFPDAFAEIVNGQVWIKNFHISEYSYSSVFNHNPDRPKKLLLHKEEIKKLTRKVETKGYTLVPVNFYLKKGLVKVSLGVCKGKKEYDKRASIKDRDVKRDLQREFSKRLRG